MKITKLELEQLYLNNSNKEVCKILGVTNATLIRYVIDANIKQKGKGNKNKKSKITIE